MAGAEAEPIYIQHPQVVIGDVQSESIEEEQARGEDQADEAQPEDHGSDGQRPCFPGMRS
jgi:hypothetical protein